jgi:hypothetical protein
MCFCVFAGNATAMTAEQMTAIEVAVATGDATKIEAATNAVMQEIIAKGGDISEAASEVMSLVVTTAVALNLDVAEVVQAASSGLIAGAVAAAAAAGGDTDAAAQAASTGATQGAQTFAEPEAFEPAEDTPYVPQPIEVPPTQDDTEPASPV